MMRTLQIRAVGVLLVGALAGSTAAFVVPSPAAAAIAMPSLDSRWAGDGVLELPGGTGGQALFAAVRADGSVATVLRAGEGDTIQSFTSAGVTDATFGGDGAVGSPAVGDIVDLRAFADGTLLVVADTVTGDGTELFRLRRNGTLDTTYGTEGSVIVRSLVVPANLFVHADGSVYLFDVLSFRVDAGGIIDTAWGSARENNPPVVIDGYGPAAVAVRPDGRFGGVTAGGAVFTLDADGDPSFTGSIPAYPTAPDPFAAVVFAPDSSMIVVANGRDERYFAYLWVARIAPTCCVVTAQRRVASSGALIPESVTRLAHGSIIVGTLDGALQLNPDLTRNASFGRASLWGTGGVSVGVTVAGDNVYVPTATPGASRRAVLARAIPAAVPAVSIGRYVSLAQPVRVVDTRTNIGLTGRSLAQTPREVPLGAVSGLPTNALAIATNVTVVGMDAGWANLYPTGLVHGAASSSVNARRGGSATAGFTLARLAPGRRVSLVTSSNAHVVIDVFGYWVPATTATSGRYVSGGAEPTRIFESRASAFGAQRLRAGETRVVATGQPTMSAALVNIAAISPLAAGYVTGFGTTRPRTSNLNVLAGETRANLAVVPLRSDGTLQLYTSSSMHVTVDVLGYFTGATAASSSSGLFAAVAPLRMIDTRRSWIGVSTPTSAVRGLTVSGDGGVPINAANVVASVVTTGTEREAPLQAGSSVTFESVAPYPRRSVLYVPTAGATVSNLTVARPTGAVWFARPNAGGALIIDVIGYFTN